MERSGPRIRSKGVAIVLLVIMVILISASFTYCLERTVVETTDRMSGKEIVFENEVTSVIKPLYSDAYAITDDGIYSFDLDGIETVITGDVSDAEIGDCYGDLVVLMDDDTMFEHHPGTGLTTSPVKLDGELELVGVYDRVSTFPAEDNIVVLHQRNTTGERLVAMNRIDGSMTWCREISGPVIEVCSDFGSWYVSILYGNGSVEVLSALNGNLLSYHHVDGVPLEMDLGEDFRSLSVISVNGSYRLTVFDPRPDTAATLGTLTFDEPVFDLNTLGLYERQCLRNSSHLMIVQGLKIVRSIPLPSSGHYDVALFMDMFVVSDGTEAVGYSLWDERPYWKAEMPLSGGIFIDPEGKLCCTYGTERIGCLDIEDGWLGDRGHLLLTFVILPAGSIASTFIVVRYAQLNGQKRIRMDRTGIRDKLKVVLAGGAVAFVAFLILADGEVLHHYGDPLAFAVTGSAVVMLTLPVALIRLPPSGMRPLTKLLLAGFISVMLSLVASLVAGLVIWGAGINYLYGGVAHSIDGAIGTFPELAILALIVAMPVGHLGGRWIDRLYPKEDVRVDGPNKVRFFTQNPMDLVPGEIVHVLQSTDEQLDMKKKIFMLQMISLPFVIVMLGMMFMQDGDFPMEIVIGLGTMLIFLTIVTMFVIKQRIAQYGEPIIFRTNGIEAYSSILYRRGGLNGFIHVSRIESLELVNVRYAEQVENLAIKLRTHDGGSRTIGVREKKVAQEILDLAKRTWNGQ